MAFDCGDQIRPTNSNDSGETGVSELNQTGPWRPSEVGPCPSSTEPKPRTTSPLSGRPTSSSVDRQGQPVEFRRDTLVRRRGFEPPRGIPSLVRRPGDGSTTVDLLEDGFHGRGPDEWFGVVVVGLDLGMDRGLRPAPLQRQPRLGAVEGLDLLFSSTQRTSACSGGFM